MADGFRARVRSQLRLALLADCGCDRTLADLQGEARGTGLTGAEIDAALGGRSFDARTAAALAYVCAAKSANPELIEQARQRALRFGMSDCEIADLAMEAQQILASISQ